MTQSELNGTHSTDIEQMVLAACMVRLDIYMSVKERLHKELFTDLESIKVYEIFAEMEKEGKQPNLPEVGQLLMSRGGDITKFMKEGAMSCELTKQHVDMLTDLWIRRRLQQLCYKGLSLVNDSTTELSDIDTLVKDFEQTVIGGDKTDVQSFSEVTDELLNDVAVRKSKDVQQGMMTGIHLFDSHYGWHEGDLIIMAGETSQGKSTLATTIAKNMAVNGLPVAFYSMEMSAKQLAARIMAGSTLVASSQTLYGKLNDDEYNRMYDTTMSMKDLPIYFDERSKISFMKICASIRKMVKTYGVKVVFIDYLQILANGGRDNREQIIGDMARDLKRLAEELGICIVALSQLARAGGKETNKEPTISRLRGSGQIEEAADIVILIFRPEVYGVKSYSNGVRTEGTAKLYIAKGRNIGLGAEVVRFDGRLSFFADIQKGDPESGWVEHNEKLPF